MTWLVIILASLASAVLYRAGGMGKERDAEPAWMPMFMRNTNFRDVGCSIISCLLIGVLVVWHWSLVLVFISTLACLKTYWKFGKRNALWYHWLITGAMYSVATLPFVFVCGQDLWEGFIARTVILGGLTMMWSELNGDAKWEEMGRGALLTLTIPLLLV